MCRADARARRKHYSGVILYSVDFITEVVEIAYCTNAFAIHMHVELLTEIRIT